jgi:hypothetical protein
MEQLLMLLLLHLYRFFLQLRVSEELRFLKDLKGLWNKGDEGVCIAHP